MRDRLDGLREQLLRAGIAPRWIARYEGELRDHLDDIVAELMAGGLSVAAARVAAERRLGDDEALALPLLLDPRLRTWAQRVPGLVYLLLPLLAQVMVPVLLVVGLIALSAEAVAGAVAACVWLVTPLAVGWGIAGIALRRRARIGWPVAGIMLTLLLGTALRLGLTPPSDGGAGDVAIALGLPALPQLLLFGLLTIPPFLVLNRRLEAE